MPRPILAVFGAIALVGTGAAYLAFENAVDSAAGARPPDTAIAGSPRDADDPSPERVDAPMAKRLSVREWLAEYYGAAWSAVEPGIAAMGTDLDRTLSADEIPRPWEEVASQVHEEFVLQESEIAPSARGMVDWPEVIDREFLRSRYGVKPDDVSDADLANIRAIAADHAPAIDEHAQAFYRGIADEIERAWCEGRFRKAPLLMPPDDGPRPRVIGVKSLASKTGWCASVVVYRDEHPDLTALQTEVRRLAEARSAAIRDYMRPLEDR